MIVQEPSLPRPLTVAESESSPGKPGHAQCHSAQAPGRPSLQRKNLRHICRSYGPADGEMLGSISPSLSVTSQTVLRLRRSIRRRVRYLPSIRTAVPANRTDGDPPHTVRGGHARRSPTNLPQAVRLDLQLCLWSLGRIETVVGDHRLAPLRVRSGLPASTGEIGGDELWRPTGGRQRATEGS